MFLCIMEGRTQALPVFFPVVAAGAQLKCCIRQTGDQASDPSYELLVVDAVKLRTWSTRFSLAAVNAALQDEELCASDMDQVLAAVLPCQQAVVAVMQPDNGALRLESWCHRTARVPLLPPTHQQRAPDSDYRQAAFCISLPVSPDLDGPQWMTCHTGQAFADTNAGLLSACFHNQQQLQDSVLLLQSQLQLLHNHTAQLQQLADKAVTTAVRGTAGLKEDPTKKQQQQQQQQRQLKVSPSGKATVSTRAGEGAALTLASQGSGHVPFFTTGSQVSPAKGLGVSGAASSSIQVQRAGSGNSSRAAGGAAAGGGRAHFARQQQDEQALRQMWAEQQSIRQDWQAKLQPLVAFEGELDAFVQLAAEAGVSAVVAGGRHAEALPWHLRQQEDERHQQQHHVEQQRQGQDQHLQQQDGGQDLEQHKQQQTQLEPSAKPAAAGGGGGESAVTHVQPQHVDSNAPKAAPPGSAEKAAATAATAAGAAATNSTNLGAAAAAAAAGLAPPGLVAVVAPARQKQAAAQKRKAADVLSLLKRGRR